MKIKQRSITFSTAPTKAADNAPVATGMALPDRPDDETGKPGIVTWISLSNKQRTEPATVDLLDQEIYCARPIRSGHKYPGKRNYAGHNWFANTGEHVWYESLLERDSLLWLDFTFDIVAITSQPMRMGFADGSHHFPDFLAMHADHKQVVYDVKPLEKITETVQAQFDKTRLLCQQIGWGYRVLSEVGPTEQINLQWLSNYRQIDCAPPLEAQNRLLNALSQTPMTLGAALEVLALPHRGVCRAGVYYLIWSGAARIDMTLPLSDSTLITGASK